MEGGEFQRFFAGIRKREAEARGVRELKGQAASPGMARGPAKVVRGIHDLEKVNRGDIDNCVACVT
jgi:phosphoenolpyruvate synthase/pyruvate phosphate dikinase